MGSIQFSASVLFGLSVCVIEHDVKQSIGRRYARMDEAGTPFCFTVDGETAASQSVTARDRDSGGQERVALDQVGNWLSEKLGLG